MNSSMLGKALEYIDLGWKIFPLHTAKNSACSCGNQNCSSAAKHPHIKEWQKCCSNNSDQIKEWWDKWPEANIGLATGSSSALVVLDIDPRHGGKESLQELVRKNGMFPKTLTSNTGGGGYHLFFKEPMIKITNRTNVLPGIDVRGEGGYVVAPPSFHQSGKQYSWTKELDQSAINEAPPWLLDFITKNNKSQGAVEGDRNNFLTREAGKLRRLGLDEYQLFTELKKINLDRCHPSLPDHEVMAICSSISRYPTGEMLRSFAVVNSWTNEPKTLELAPIEVPSMPASLLPECFKPWIMDISERMQVTPEFVMAPALVSFSSIVGRRIGILPKRHDNWLKVPNLWGAIVARPGYFKSPTIAEAIRPLEKLSDRARKVIEDNQHQNKANQMFISMQLEALKESIKKAIKEDAGEYIDQLKNQVAELERDAEALKTVERRYKTNDATVEKMARLLNENPNGLLLLRDELNGWLQILNKAGREGDREFFLEAWNGYNSYTIDRVGSGTFHVPALCLSVFGGIQPGKLQAYVAKALQGNVEDDGLLQRFQLLIYPELSPEWKNIDREPNLLAQERVFELFEKIDSVPVNKSTHIAGVNFCSEAQEVFNSWRCELEKRLRSNEIGCLAFESHLAKYRSLMPSLALLFWILENPENIHGQGSVSAAATNLAIEWCNFLEQHALKAYGIDKNAQIMATKKLAEVIQQGLLENGMPVRSIYRKQWTHLKTPQLLEHALETLEELHWLRQTVVTVQGGRTKKIELHPNLRKTIIGDQNDYQIRTGNYGPLKDYPHAHGGEILGPNNHQIQGW